MGSKLSVDDSVCVVIVGGGFGGIAAASQLKSWGIPFILVDMRDAFHHNVAALRASVESGFAKKTFISYSVSFGSSFRQAKVVGIDLEKTQVLLNDGKEISYSHLILATGSDGPFPGKFNQIIDMETAIHTYEDMVKEVQKSSRIVVVGGGAAGVEMAAEIKTEYPAKECFLPEEVGISVAMKSLTVTDSQCLLFIKARPEAALSNLTAHCPTITLIHSKMALADVELLPCVRQEVKEILFRKGVHILLSESVSNLQMLTLNQFQEDMVVKTDKGTEIAADLVILCTGIKINSSAYNTAFKDKMASNGALKVNKHLQVEGYDNIYAIGDCADVKEPKMAYHAGLHANIVVANIINSLTQKPLKTYQPGSLSFLLSMGRNDGVGQINGCYVGRLLVTIAKSRDLFISKSWKTMGQTMPH
ncbi:PREDICTED: apoptosis-inducing factor 2 isoform X1 [Crocodylus porosus]|uniref:apoptosis-inducing factor 2 isoform X1 n=1 Tax=Crocodylus porosus TaxID=8502 RepID=UPI00093F35D4|nr:PREDICTED: apoptosis-inducing factor 2 isoform X1 [Crocodylus porosus]